MVTRPVSATVRSSDPPNGGAARTIQRPIRPHSAVHRKSAEVLHGGGSTAGEVRATAQQPSVLAGNRPRPLSAKKPLHGNNKAGAVVEAPKPSAASLAVESCKRCIRDIFDVCEQLHLDEMFTTALHQSLKHVAITDVSKVSRILQCLTDNRSATLQVLRKVDARERVLQCLEVYTKDAFLDPCGFSLSAVYHSSRASDFVSSIGLGVQGLLDARLEAVEEALLGLSKVQLMHLTSEGDAILESLSQCTEGVERELEKWDQTMEALWGSVQVVEEEHASQVLLASSMAPSTSAGGLVFDSPPKLEAVSSSKPLSGPYNTVRIHQHPAAMAPSNANLTTSPSPERSLLSSRNSSSNNGGGTGGRSCGGAPMCVHHPFLWRSIDYKNKMREDAKPFFTLQEKWSLGNLARVAEFLERKEKRERLLANDDALRTHTEAVVARARDEFLGIAATKIQTHFRRHQAQLWFQMYIVKRRAVSLIEKWWRRLKTRARFVRATDGGKAAMQLQRLWRAYVVRKKFPALIRANRAARKIQRWWRFWDCHFRMVIRQLQRQHRIYAAAVVARIVRLFVVRWRGRQRRRSIDAVRLLQRVSRALTERDALREAHQRNTNMTIIAPCHFSLIEELAGSDVSPSQSLQRDRGEHDGNDSGSPSFQGSGSPSASSPTNAQLTSSSSPLKPFDAKNPTPSEFEPMVVTLRRGAPEAVRGSIESPVGKPRPVVYDRSALLGLAQSRTRATVDCGTMPMTPRQSSTQAHTSPPTQSAKIDHNQVLAHADLGTQQSAYDSSKQRAVNLVSALLWWRYSSSTVCARQVVVNQMVAEPSKEDKRDSKQRNKLVESTGSKQSASSDGTARRVANRRPNVLRIAAAKAIQQWWQTIVVPRMRRREPLEQRLLAEFSQQERRPRETRKVESNASAISVAVENNVEARHGTTTTSGVARATVNASPLHHASHPSSSIASACVDHTTSRPVSGSCLLPIVLPNTSATADTLRKRKQAAVLVANWSARILRRRAARRRLEDHCASVIARSFRMFKLQRSYFNRRHARAEEARKQEEIARMVEEELVQSRRRAAALQILYWFQELKCKALLRKLDNVSAMINNRPDRDANARRIQQFWIVARQRMLFLRMSNAQDEQRRNVVQQERIRNAVVKIQGHFRRHQHRHDIEMRRKAFQANRSLAATVIQKYVRKWLAKNIYWQEKITKLSMFRELQKLRQKDRIRVSGAPLAAPKHAW